MIPDFQLYLESIRAAYGQWWELYTPTDAQGREKTRARQSVPFDFGLIVQTVKREERERRDEEKVESFPVLEGIRKYADQHVLLIGRPGSGKSTALARLMLEETTTPQARIPVLVELRYWQGSIEQLIRDSLTRHDLPDEQVEAVLQRFAQSATAKETLILFDGVNELPSEEARSQLSAFRRNHPKVPMIFTTRDLSLGGDLGIEKKLEMQPLTEAQMQAFLRSYVPEQAEEMLRQLKDRLREFGQTPLLLWMLCEVFQQTPDNRLPSNLSEVFQAFTAMYENSSVRKHEVALLKGDVRPLSDRRVWKKALKGLALVMMQGETPVDFRVVIHRDEAERQLRRIFSNEQFPVRDILDDLLKYHLLQNRSIDQIEFRHQLIQEYYAAEGLLERLPELSDEVLKREYLNYLKWTEPVALMLALVNSETQAVNVVKQGLDVYCMLGARLAGEVRQEFQEKTIETLDGYEFQENLPVRDWLKLEFFGASKSNAAIPKITRTLDDVGNQGIYANAAETLGRLGTQAATQALIKMLQHWSDSARYGAAEALGMISSDESIAGLQLALRDDDLSVACTATDSLAQIGTIEVIPALLEALEHSSSNVTKRAISALGEINSLATIPILQQSLKHKDWQVRYKAIEFLRDRGGQASLPLLVEVLEDSNDHVRQKASKVIEELRTSQSTKQRYFSRNPKQQISSSEKEAISRALEHLDHQDPEVRRQSAALLGEVGSKQEIPRLISALEQEENVRVKRELAFTLGQLGSKKAIVELIKALSDELWYDRHQAVQLLGSLRCTEAVGLIIEAIDDPEREVWQAAMEALGDMRSEEAIPQLAQALKESAVDGRFGINYFAANALAKIGSESAVHELLKAWRNGDLFSYDCPQVFSALKQSNAWALPVLVSLIPDETDNPILDVISNIQANCKYYNYEIYQSYLEAQKNDRQKSQNSDRSSPIYNIESVGILNTGTVNIAGNQNGVESSTPDFD